ncbi:MAG: glutamate racemase [Gemmatimonadota bacterium]|nr:glutamate racemase [Gemmatimonadota bacterium]
MIGVFDSGVGGLAVFRELDRSLPDADILYFSDSACFPYGSRPSGWLKERTSAITRAFLERGCSLVVLACNTATVVAIESLRRDFPETPFVGVVPPVKVASSLKPQKKIIVLMTENTSAGEKYAELVNNHVSSAAIEEVRLPLLAQVVEDLSFFEPEVARKAALSVAVLLGGAKPESFRLVLGCTHYVFLTPALKKHLGPGIEILDPCQAVAAQVARVCKQHSLPVGQNGTRRFLCTGDPRRFSEQLEALLGIKNQELEQVELP